MFPPAALLRFVAIALLLGAPAAGAAESASPSTPVRVIAERSAGRFGGGTYRYVVINNASAPITAILIGFDGYGCACAIDADHSSMIKIVRYL